MAHILSCLIYGMVGPVGAALRGETAAAGGLEYGTWRMSGSSNFSIDGISGFSPGLTAFTIFGVITKTSSVS